MATLNDLPFDYTIVADSVSPEDFSFGPGDQQATMVIRCAGEELTRSNIEAAFLGYTTVGDTADGPRLNRKTPVRHPARPWLWAVRVAAIVGEGVPDTPSDMFQKLKYGRFVRYKKLMIRVVFSALPYDIYEDAQKPISANDYPGGKTLVDAEWRRYAVLDRQVSSEFIVRPGQTLVYGVGSPDAIRHTSFRGQWRIRVVKEMLQITQFQIPHQAVFHSDGRLSDNITGSLNKVNSATFLGCHPGEILYLAPRIAPANQPVPPSLLGFTTDQASRSYDITHSLHIFRPPVPVNPTHYGWQCVPPPPGTGLTAWYPASTDTTVTAVPLFGNVARAGTDAQYLLYQQYHPVTPFLPINGFTG